MWELSTHYSPGMQFYWPWGVDEFVYYTMHEEGNIMHAHLDVHRSAAQFGFKLSFSRTVFTSLLYCFESDVQKERGVAREIYGEGVIASWPHARMRSMDISLTATFTNHHTTLQL